ncbi:spore cortex biosynthesis protein YabQ [Lachnoclostridium sp.]|uniref:spore cortex biosynthesis protein YabQ n=2 Tax=Lachnoclostridium sp. TaxID=2028282 RepID=UPI0028995282|nr:spore cortex biosynthesis protein YabQ [Lachnoclostridium sp.]
MNTSIFLELRYLAAASYWGIILFLVYDLLRILRNTFHHGKIVIGIQDICFWIVAGILIFRMMYLQNDGMIRWYSTVAMVLSMVLYQKIFSPMIVGLGTKFTLFIKNCILRLLKLLVSPIMFIISKIKKIIRFLFGKFRKFGRFLGGKVKKRTNIFKACIRKQLKKHLNKVKINKRKQVEEVPTPKVERPRGVLELITQPQEKGEVSEKE